MPSATIHYDGWVQLPERLRKALGVGVGDRLEAELVDGGLVLRAARAKGSAAQAPEAPPTHEEPRAAHEDAPMHEGEPITGRVAPGVRKARGKRKAASTEAPAAQTR